jgi:predicted NBD/HSP70 family sugar kinase
MGKEDATMRNGHYYLGADLGGTSLRLGAVTQDGRLAQVLSAPTGRTFGPDELRAEVGTLMNRLADMVRTSEWQGAGFGTAGVVPHDGPLRHSDNLPRLIGTNIRPLLEEVVGREVALENDARCFTLAEARFGAAKGARNVCGITLGTGIGSGLIVDGKIHRGTGSQAGEVCRIPLRGRNLEYYLSEAGLKRAYQEAGGNPEGQNGALLAEAARRGDAAAAAAWRAFSGDLAFLCEVVICVMEPDVIVVGGALAQARDLLNPAVDEKLRGAVTRVVYSELGPYAGVIGAAALGRAGHAAPSYELLPDVVNASRVER